MSESKKLTELVESIVIVSRAGRSLASIGAILTNAEKEKQKEVYSRLKSGEEIDARSPTVALVTSKKGKRGKISISDAVDWFIEEYPKESFPLQEKRKEKKPGTTNLILAYGLKGKEDFADEDYITAIVGYTNCERDKAALLWYGFLKPQIERLDDLKGLTEVKVK
jgi:hypothetical protein